MTLYHYIGANNPLTMGNFGEKFTLKRLSEIPKPDDPLDLRNILDLSHLENEWVKVYETELDFAYIAITNLRDSVIKDLLPMNKLYIYELGGSFLFDEEEITNNISVNQANEKCVNELISYVSREIKEGESIDVYSCWDSEEGLPFIKEEVINLNTYQLGNSFVLSERQLIRFMKK